MMRADFHAFQTAIPGAYRHASGGRGVINVHVDRASLAATFSGLNLGSRLIANACRMAVMETTQTTTKYAEHRAPEGATGKLKSGITGRMSGRYTGIVNSRAHYSAAVDEGTRPHTIRPREAKALAIRDRLDIGTKRRILATEKDVNRIISRSRAASRSTLGARTRNAAGRTPTGQVAHTDNFMQRRTMVFANEVQHPGSRSIPFFTGAAMVAGRLLSVNANRRIAQAIRQSATIGVRRGR